MQNDGSDVAVGEHRIDFSNLEEQGSIENLEKEGGGEGRRSLGERVEEDDPKVVTIVISNGELASLVPATTEPKVNAMASNEGSCASDPVLVIDEPKMNFSKTLGTNKDEILSSGTTTKNDSLSRSESSHEQCRICQQQMEENLIDLGCKCRGGLAKAHRSCIDTWFRTRGSNKCEICQQIATNVPPPESQPSRNYWVWRIDSTFRGPGITPEPERGCYSPLWVAFSILIGGLLLDVLISITLGVSALPVNIIIGVLVVLGVGTALRLALECCHEMSLRRAAQRVETNISIAPLGYHPAL